MRTLDSCWAACRDYLSFPDLYADGIMPWEVPEVWLFSFSPKYQNSEILIRITQSMLSLKYKSLLQHESQYTDPNGVWNDLVDIGNAVGISHGKTQLYEGKLS